MNEKIRLLYIKFKNRFPAKSKLKIIGFILSILTFIFVLTEHYGLWNNIRCTNQLLEFNSRIQTSYAEVPRIVIPSSPEWSCVINLIYKYAQTDFPKDKEPLVITRFVATASYKQDVGNNKFVEWTAPSTPIAVLYKEWPGNSMGPDDYRIVGSIGDFSDWIEKDKNEFNFKTQNFFLGILSITVSFLIL